ncbi:hypothetical protein RND81_05G037300 [Saponaria officinalis]|uniref:Transposase n=1 Tax=Saponaria officinalis TaxID=3572 RepID=A0AAW1KQR2_SAPOF
MFTNSGGLPPSQPPRQSNTTSKPKRKIPQKRPLNPPLNTPMVVQQKNGNLHQQLLQNSNNHQHQQLGNTIPHQEQHQNNSNHQQQQLDSNIPHQLHSTQQHQAANNLQHINITATPQSQHGTTARIRRRVRNQDNMLVTLQHEETVRKLREWVRGGETSIQVEPLTNQPLPTSTIKQKRLSNMEKRRTSQAMLLSYQNGKLKHGYINELSHEFGVKRLAISTIWKDIQAQLKAGEVVNVDRKYHGRKCTKFIDVEKVKSIELKDRICLKDLAAGLGFSITTVWRLVQKGEMVSHTSDIRPSLTKKNKIARINWVLSKISASSLGGNLVYDTMYDIVHIDEKFFTMTRTTTNYYMLPNEPRPHRTCQSKRFISKIMFMAAVARPRYDKDGVVLFDGKIGIFPFVYEAEALRSSKNRKKGTLEVKPIESIKKEVIKQCLIEKVIPAIKAKWPLDASRRIYIQQDNAKPHILPQDLDFLSVANLDGFDINLVCQPPNSPDLNILDLEFFRSIQTLQHKKCPESILELIESVGKAYAEVDDEKLKFVWVSLHACMNEIL